MDDILKINKATYDSLASEYERKVSKRRDFNESVISNFVPYISTGKKVLDIGCAVGLDTAVFVEKGFVVTGIELSVEMADYARKRNPSSNIIVGDFMNISFDEKFDAIFAQAYIHLYPKNESNDVLLKMKNLLTIDGVAHITTSKSMISNEGWFAKNDYTGNHKRFRKHWTKNELESSLLSVGFSIINYYEIMDPYCKTWMVFTAKNG